MGKKITCIKNNKNVFRNTDLCRIFNCFLSNIFSKLNIPKQHYVQNDLDSEPNYPFSRFLKITQSMKNIKNKNIDYIFTFEATYPDALRKAIN